MPKKIKKSTVINKDSIEAKLKYYYSNLAEIHGISKEQAKNSIIKIDKLSVYMDYSFIHIDDVSYDLENEDDDMEIEHYANSQMAMWLDGMLEARFNIMPATAHITFEVDGLMLDWIPAKPMYVTSFDEYLNLYKSFIAYIEDNSRYPYGHGHLDGKANDFEDAKFKICGSALYSNMNIIETELPKERAEPLFTEESFNTSKTTILTHEGYFISVDDYCRRITKMK